MTFGISILTDHHNLADVWSNQVLAEHNAARAQYGARPLQWSAGLYPAVLQYAQACKFVHRCVLPGSMLAIASFTLIE